MMQTAPAAAAVVKALRATEKRMEKIFVKKREKNDSSTKFSPQNTRKKQKASQTSAMMLMILR